MTRRASTTVCCFMIELFEITQRGDNQLDDSVLVNNVQVDDGNLISYHSLITADLLIRRNAKPKIQFIVI
jgi:hypothetical protein